jgi:hypothetical protein
MSAYGPKLNLPSTLPAPKKGQLFGPQSLKNRS